MARHRNVRNMNFDDDYEGYNDVYGHSVEDNYCVSPSASQYLYNRGEPNQISAFFAPEGDDIQEEPEDDVKRALDSTSERLQSLTLESAAANLLPEEEILLKSCLEEIQNVMGDSMPDAVIISQILRAKFNMEKALDACLRGATESKSQPQAVQTANVLTEVRYKELNISHFIGQPILQQTQDNITERKSDILIKNSSSQGKPSQMPNLLFAAQKRLVIKPVVQAVSPTPSPQESHLSKNLRSLAEESGKALVDVVAVKQGGPIQQVNNNFNKNAQLLGATKKFHMIELPNAQTSLDKRLIKSPSSLGKRMKHASTLCSQNKTAEISPTIELWSLFKRKFPDRLFEFNILSPDAAVEIELKKSKSLGYQAPQISKAKAKG